MEDSLFNLETSKKMMANLAKHIPKEFSKNANTKEIFGYYSLVISATLEVYLGNYQVALDIISQISLDYILIYSKSFGCLLNFFLTASYAYFMLEQYKESARLS